MRRQLVAIATALVLAAAACGGDDDNDSSATTAGDDTTTTAAADDTTTTAAADLPTQAELAAQYKIPEFADLTIVGFQEGLEDGAVAVHYTGSGSGNAVLNELTGAGWFTATVKGELSLGGVQLVQDAGFFATLMLFPPDIEPSMDPQELEDLIVDTAPQEVLDQVPDYINLMGLTREYLIFAFYRFAGGAAAN